MDARQYLADAAAVAAAVRDFAAVLASAGPRATPAGLRGVTPSLVGALRRAEAAAAQLETGRLADERLEAQRERTLPALTSVLTAMRDVARAARFGKAAATAAATGRLGAALAALRASGSSSP
ncbi:MAG: hypothetical protein QOK40_802 [Miltoncostaeaceae bacterium]|jgi:hypothetical protein|nr:hypothetical protein [Miltoncostaeaceae bacterium]